MGYYQRGYELMEYLFNKILVMFFFHLFFKWDLDFNHTECFSGILVARYSKYLNDLRFEIGVEEVVQMDVGYVL
jgi:hypothetical protein